MVQDFESDGSHEQRQEFDQLRRAQSLSRVGSWELDVASNSITFSEVMCELHGLRSSQAPTPSSAGFDQLPLCAIPEDREAIATVIRHLLLGGPDVTFRYRTVLSSHWIEGRATAIRDDSGRVDRLLGTAADISGHVLAEAELRLANALLSEAHNHQQAVISATPDAIHIYDVATATMARANLLSTELVGYTPEIVSVMAGIDLPTLLPAADLAEFQGVLGAAIQAADAEVLQLRHRVRHPEGAIHWLSRRLTPFGRTATGTVKQVLIVTRDITAVVAVEEQLAHAALHDDLTGLPNRRLVRDRLEHALERVDRAGQVAVLYCDLDGFKAINDAYGHLVGDQVLAATAQRLLGVIRTGDTVGRMGGDEFVVVLEISEPDEPTTLADAVAERIRLAVAEVITIDGVDHSVKASIGISLAAQGASAMAMISIADGAMYQVKSTGGNGYFRLDGPRS